jgi:hypothetical protein
MKKISLFLVLPLFLITTILTSCKRKCASFEGAGTDIWLGKTHVIAPSAFTPNNQDGINDTYSFGVVNPPSASGESQITAIAVKDFRMEISKPGELLFETFAWGGVWNGQSKSGKKIDGLVDVQYSISDYDNHVSEGSFKLFVVPSGCLEECMQKHIFGDMINPNDGLMTTTKENFCH